MRKLIRGLVTGGRQTVGLDVGDILAYRFTDIIGKQCEIAVVFKGQMQWTWLADGDCARAIESALAPQFEVNP